MALVGFGYDSHRFVGGRPLILGGVRIAHSQGLSGHSDADALLHAIIDAILGAAGMGDIGEQFPDTDERFRGADSAVLLAQALQWITRRGLRVAHCDATVIAQMPKLTPHKAAMRQRIAGLLSLEAEAVSVKAKTNEGMGWIGRGEGLAAVAVVTLEPIASAAEDVSQPAEQAGQAPPVTAGSPSAQTPAAETPDAGAIAAPPPLPPAGFPPEGEGPSVEDIREAHEADARELGAGFGFCPHCGRKADAEEERCSRCGKMPAAPASSNTGCAIVFLTAVTLVLMLVMMIRGLP